MDKKTSIELVKLYQSHKVLWDSLDKSFYNKQSRASAWKDISFKLNIPVKDIKKKITNLRGILRKERYKSRQSRIKDGPPYESCWFLFKHLSFLDNLKSGQLSDTQPSTSTVTVNLKTEKQKPEEKNNTDSQLKNNEAAKGDMTEPVAIVWVSDQKPQSKSRKRSRNTKITNSKIPRSNDSHQCDDLYDTFGKLVASELRKYDNHTLAYVKKAIMDVIFKADIDSLPVFQIEQNCGD